MKVILMSTLLIALSGCTTAGTEKNCVRSDPAKEMHCTGGDIH